MKVIYICPKSFYFTQGYRGRVIHAKGIVEGLLENGCEVEIISGPEISKFIKKQSRLKITSIGNKQESRVSELFWRKKLIRYLKNHIDGKDILIIRYGFSNPLFSLKVAGICEKNNCTSVIEVNSLGADNSSIPRFLSSKIRYFETLILSKFDKIYVVSKEEEKRIKTKNPDIGTVVIPNATNKKNIAREDKDNNVRFVYLGVLHHYYNFEEVISAFHRVNNKYSNTLSLMVYGYGNSDRILKDASEKFPNIKMMGKYDNNMIEKLVNRDSDILLLPYKKGTIAEIGSPMKLFEYMVLGVPLLASNVGQINDVIKDKVNGYMYESGNVDDLSNKMGYLIENKEERKKVGYFAHHEVIEEHTWKRRMNKILNSV